MNHSVRLFFKFVIDILLLTLSFYLIGTIRSGSGFVWSHYRIPFAGLLLAWSFTSIVGSKFSISARKTSKQLILSILFCNLLALTIVSFGIIALQLLKFSRVLIFGTMALTTILEVISFTIYYFAMNFKEENESFSKTSLVTKTFLTEEEEQADLSTSIVKPIEAYYIPPFNEEVNVADTILVTLWQRYLSDIPALFDVMNNHLDLQSFSRQHTLVLDSETYYNIRNQDPESLQLFVNLHRMNDFRRINRYFIKVNENLREGGVFVCCGQSITQRKNTFTKNYTPFFGNILYFIDFVYKRILPKLPYFQGIYFALTKGRGRALSETEMLGRLYYCGFEVIRTADIDSQLFFITRKIRKPRNDNNPTYGPLIKLNRTGLAGKPFHLYKFRTMHPYSEYLQEFVYRQNGLADGGKFKDDFRVTTWGKIMRKCWLDELPQVINLLKRDIVLVGVRALSQHYLSLYPDDVKELRRKFRPGLLPPAVAESIPDTLDAIIESERRYLLAKCEHPYLTDFRYFWKIFYKIIFGSVRSN